MTLVALKLLHKLYLRESSIENSFLFVLNQIIIILVENLLHWTVNRKQNYSIKVLKNFKN
ncbi:MAG: hypothetical protein DRN04_06000 [Thermoprotei archaeon]|nr:MAG: hypothetical protein DRN04_06000 [Thermoprotei archaeon]